MSHEFCPNCGALRNMRVSKIKNKKPDANGEVKEVTIVSYHCEECNTFVRSEEIKEG